LSFWCIFGAGQGRLGTRKRNRSNDLDLNCVHLAGRCSIQLRYGRNLIDSKTFAPNMVFHDRFGTKPSSGKREKRVWAATRKYPDEVDGKSIEETNESYTPSDKRRAG
jgi:hypothetical protein